MTTGEKIAKLRADRNLSQAALAEQLNIGTSTLGMWETGKRGLKDDTLKMIANFFDVSVDYLLDISDEPNTLKNTVPIAGEIPEEYTIPILGRIAASAPAGLVSDYEGEISIQPSSIKRYGRKDIFALRVLGDSMNRIIPEGAIAIIHKTCDWEDGDICAVTINGDDATLKEVTKTDRGIKFTPLSYSKFHAPWEYIKDEDEVDVIIHGVFLYGIITTDKM
ncbi:helix-turn-helix domain-containing protein [Enterococcus xiangfangensis]|uniref:helix-turn-helix domain-containing protein n=1 Tax=Enterococcus xiangfangensis TaxID=1296537 RepID=UPI003D164333|nr:XRE family transcriptional regulator [Enterococcus asini]